jgi:hypothetical protein
MLSTLFRYKYVIGFISLFLLCSTPVFAFEDGLISTDKKLSEIKIQDNTVIDVFPLYTIMNEKNTLIVHPLKAGKTKFSVVKDGKKTYVFNVKVTEDETIIDAVEGFDIFQIDCPPNFYEFELDIPPEIYMEENSQ